MCSSGYFDRHTSLNEAMRKILVDWLVDVHRKFKLRTVSLFMAINLVDRYLEATTESVSKSKYQLFGITCLFIAAKYEEIYPPGLGDFVYVCADTYNASQILDMESQVLNTLEFNLVYSSSLQLFGIHAEEGSPKLTVGNIEEREKHLVTYLLFLGLVNYQVSVQPDKLKLAAALFLASKIMHSKSSGIDGLSRTFGLRHEDIKALALEMFTFLGNEETEERHTAVRRMFNHSQYGYISTIKLTFKLQ